MFSSRSIVKKSLQIVLFFLFGIRIAFVQSEACDEETEKTNTIFARCIKMDRTTKASPSVCYIYFSEFTEFFKRTFFCANELQAIPLGNNIKKRGRVWLTM
jgi:hypothetical protein